MPDEINIDKGEVEYLEELLDGFRAQRTELENTKKQIRQIEEQVKMLNAQKHAVEKTAKMIEGYLVHCKQSIDRYETHLREKYDAGNDFRYSDGVFTKKEDKSLDANSADEFPIVDDVLEEKAGD